MATKEHTETTTSLGRKINRNSGGDVCLDTDADMRQFMTDTSRQLAGLTMLLTNIENCPDYGVKELREVIQDMTWQMQQAVEMLFATEQANG